MNDLPVWPTDLYRCRPTELPTGLVRDAKGRITDASSGLLVCAVSGRSHREYLRAYWLRHEGTWVRAWIDKTELRRVASRAAEDGLGDLALALLRSGIRAVLP